MANGYSITQTPSSAGLTDISGLLKQLTGEYGKTREKREQRYEQGLQTLQRVADLMAGPEFDKYAQEMHEAARRKTVGESTQNLISAGLMGTERATQPGMQFEREVGTPFRLGMAEQKAGRVAGSLGRVADYMASFPDIYPEPGTLAYLATGGFGQLSPQQKMAQSELPYLLSAAQSGGGGGTTGYTGGGGGTTGYTSGGYSSPFGSGLSSSRWGGGGGTVSIPSYSSGGTQQQAGGTQQQTGGIKYPLTMEHEEMAQYVAGQQPKIGDFGFGVGGEYAQATAPIQGSTQPTEAGTVIRTEGESGRQYMAGYVSAGVPQGAVVSPDGKSWYKYLD